VAGGFREEAEGLLPGFTVGSRMAQYRLEERVGAGGTAVVFRAWDERLRRWVALKILAPNLAGDEVFRRRFLREARAAAIDDPHIIPVFEAGDAAGALFIAMRYVPSGDVRSLVRRTGRLSWGRVSGIVSSVASALDTAHAAGLVHRDVKPANILVDVRPGHTDHAYLSDFGLSQGRLGWNGPSGQGQFMGTLGYAAPEQLAGRPADGRADQYSLGCSAFELLAGSPPFPREDPGAVIWAHMSEPPPPLTSRRPELPAAVDRVLAKTLAKEPADRYDSCRDFASALCAALALAPSGGDGSMGLDSGSRQDETTWPSSASSEQAEDLPAAAAATVSRRRPLRARPTGPGRHSRQKLRLSVIPAAMLIAVLSVLGAMSQLGLFRPGTSIPAAVHAKLSAPSYLGVYLPGQPPAYRHVADFVAAAGRMPNIVGCAINWGDPFATSFDRNLRKHGEVPLIQIQPTDVTLAEIVAGDGDIYLRTYADSVRDFGHPVIIGFGQEMNARWYPWGYSHTPARMFVAAWRHIVRVFRSQGADNVTWLWTIEADQAGTGPMMSWWPGTNYVTWVGIDGFYNSPSDTFSRVFVSTIDQVRAATNRPILLSETGVAREPRQLAGILNLFNGSAQYRLAGLVWDDTQRWRLEGKPLAEEAFRAGAAGLNLATTQPRSAVARPAHQRPGMRRLVWLR
jgi:serine/threonine protein kinase